MERKCDFNEISDGKLYELNDMAKLGCNDCAGCFSCCCNTGDTIVADPYDIYRMTKGLKCEITALINKNLVLSVIDGTILPTMKMNEENGKCEFLNEEGRCSIHQFRPGICRLFPLGRIYENNSFKYFLQKDECKKTNRSKVKISKWIDTPQLDKYEKYINDWHYYLKDMQTIIRESSDETLIKNLNMFILNNFYLIPYNTDEDFYEQFYIRLDKAVSLL